MEKYIPEPPKKEEKIEKSEYIEFANERIRQDIYLFCKGLASYMADEGLKGVVFVDRAARPAWVGVNEYWNLHYKDLEKPSFFFVNPKGLETEKDDGIQKRKEILDRFSEVHGELMKKKDEPVVLFDTCSHGGDTIRLVYEALWRSGFRDIRVITAHSPDANSGVRADKDINAGENFISCYPFGITSGVKKGKDVVSTRDLNKSQWDINQTRKEIQQIMRDGENVALPPRTPRESFLFLVDELNVSDKEKRVLKSIVENERLGMLSITLVETGQVMEFPIGKSVRKHPKPKEYVASALAQTLIHIGKRKITVTFSED